ncbi:MAG TPA: hypothetical protein VGE19_07370 [Pseudoxanthomonas sp.]
MSDASCSTTPTTDNAASPVLWRAPHGSGKWMYFDHEPTHLKSYEPLYSAATVAELRAEVAEQSAWADKWKALHDAVSLAHEVQAKSLTRALDRADAAERRVGELEGALRDLIDVADPVALAPREYERIQEHTARGASISIDPFPLLKCRYEDVVDLTDGLKRARATLTGADPT